MATCFVRSWMWHMCCHLTWVVFYPPSPSNSARMNDPMILSSTSYAVSVLRSNRQFRSTCTSSNRMNNKCHTAPASCFLYRRPYLIYLFSFYLVAWHFFFSLGVHSTFCVSLCFFWLRGGVLYFGTLLLRCLGIGAKSVPSETSAPVQLMWGAAHFFLSPVVLQCAGLSMPSCWLVLISSW